MNQYSEELLSAYLDGELSGEERAGVERWLDASPTHRRMFDDLVALRREIQALPQQKLDADFSNRVLAAIRERSGISATPLTVPASGAAVEPVNIKKQSLGMPAWRYFAAGVAATIAAVIVSIAIAPKSLIEVAILPQQESAVTMAGYERSAPEAPMPMTESAPLEAAPSAPLLQEEQSGAPAESEAAPFSFSAPSSTADAPAAPAPVRARGGANAGGGRSFEAAKQEMEKAGASAFAEGKADEKSQLGDANAVREMRTQLANAADAKDSEAAQRWSLLVDKALKQAETSELEIRVPDSPEVKAQLADVIQRTQTDEDGERLEQATSGRALGKRSVERSRDVLARGVLRSKEIQVTSLELVASAEEVERLLGELESVSGEDQLAAEVVPNGKLQESLMRKSRFSNNGGYGGAGGADIPRAAALNAPADAVATGNAQIDRAADGTESAVGKEGGAKKADSKFGTPRPATTRSADKATEAEVTTNEADDARRGAPANRQAQTRQLKIRLLFVPAAEVEPNE